MNKSVWISAIVAGIITWIFMYLDAKLFDTPKSKFAYVKGVVFVSAVVGTTVYFLTGNSSQMGGTGARPGGFGNAPAQNMMPPQMDYGMGGDMIQGGMAPF